MRYIASFRKGGYHLRNHDRHRSCLSQPNCHLHIRYLGGCHRYYYHFEFSASHGEIMR
jgi:hypothetical protein